MTRSHIFPVACMIAVKFPRSTGPTGVRLERGGGYRCTPLGQCQHGGREGHSPSSPGCQRRQDRWRWRELGDREGDGGHCLDNRHPQRRGGGSDNQLLYT